MLRKKELVRTKPSLDAALDTTGGETAPEQRGEAARAGPGRGLSRERREGRPCGSGRQEPEGGQGCAARREGWGGGEEGRGLGEKAGEMGGKAGETGGAPAQGCSQGRWPRSLVKPPEWGDVGLRGASSSDGREGLTLTHHPLHPQIPNTTKFLPWKQASRHGPECYLHARGHP